MKHPYLISALSNLGFVNKHTYFKKHPYSVSVIELREYTYIDINCAWFIFLSFFSFNETDYKKSGLHLNLLTIMSTQEQSSFKQMILSPNFVMIAQLIILVRKDPRRISPYSSFFILFKET